MLWVPRGRVYGAGLEKGEVAEEVEKVVEEGEGK